MVCQIALQFIYVYRIFGHFLPRHGRYRSVDVGERSQGCSSRCQKLSHFRTFTDGSCFTHSVMYCITTGRPDNTELVMESTTELQDRKFEKNKRRVDRYFSWNRARTSMACSICRHCGAHGNVIPCIRDGREVCRDCAVAEYLPLKQNPKVSGPPTKVPGGSHAVEMVHQSCSGTLKSFCQAKSYGFIENDDGSGNVLVHVNQLNSGGPMDMIGCHMTFDIITGGTNEKLKATNVTIVKLGTGASGSSERILLPERRIDPVDGVKYTWEEFETFYKKNWILEEIAAYWKKCELDADRQGDHPFLHQLKGTDLLREQLRRYQARSWNSHSRGQT